MVAIVASRKEADGLPARSSGATMAIADDEVRH
ncbi:hypothetical protein GGQ96_004080 [Sphingomonas abaci]|uniref:Uncharacterized protein n=1 Tax=Sphingomonas abaci TaxID=237611 RepID=A0A7W7API7_9SPHN|nr:hypothetical protein [Sphingomonas abaci]